MLLRSFFVSKIFLFTVIGSLLINGLLWFFLYRNFPASSDPVFLHYTVFFGVDRIGPWYHIFLLPLSGFLILVLNGVFAWLVSEREWAVSLFLLWTAFFLQGFFLLAGVLISFLN